jgi:tetratricopeptide (TPR) repeat protein
VNVLNGSFNTSTLASDLQSVVIPPSGAPAGAQPESLYRQGQVLSTLGLHDSALKRYNRVVKDSPRNYQAWSDRGYTLERMGRYPDAIDSFNRAIGLMSHYTPAWLGKGIALGQLKDTEAALGCFDRVVQLNPNDYRAWYNRGKVLLLDKNNQAAIYSFDRALDIRPQKHQAWYHRATALAAQDLFEDAITSLDVAVMIKPECYYAWNYRGKMLMELARYSEAQESFKRSLAARDANNPDARYGQAACSALQGRLSQAMDQLSLAFDDSPDHHHQTIAQSDTRLKALHAQPTFEDLLKQKRADSKNVA